MALTIYGTITEVLPVVQGTSKMGNSYILQRFTISTGGMTENAIAFTIMNDALRSSAHLMTPGTEVGVTFWPNSRRHVKPATGEIQFFTELRASSVVPAGASVQQTAPAAPQPTTTQGYPPTANAQPQAPQPQYAQPAPSDTLPL